MNQRTTGEKERNKEQRMEEKKIGKIKNNKFSI